MKKSQSISGILLFALFLVSDIAGAQGNRETLGERFNGLAKFASGRQSPCRTHAEVNHGLCLQGRNFFLTGSQKWHEFASSCQTHPARSLEHSLCVDGAAGLSGPHFRRQGEFVQKCERDFGLAIDACKAAQR